MLPKIIFRNSWIYDQILLPIRGKEFKFPKKKDFSRIIKGLEEAWKKSGNKILAEISHVTRLKWHEKEIVIYITAGIHPFSDPLTLNVRGDTQHRIDVLTHELIHRIVSDKQNWTKLQRNWQTLMKTYKNETEITKRHVPIHAIHEHIFRKIFNSSRLNKEVKSTKHKDYQRAWEIVKQVGYKQIINKLMGS